MAQGRSQSIRRAGFALLAIAGVLVTVLGAPKAPEPVDTSRFEEQIKVALQADDANNELTEGAPQQTVVNGWTARDLLTILTKQTNALLGASQAAAGDPRVPLLLLLLLLAIAWHGATTPGATPALASPDGHLAPSTFFTRPPAAADGDGASVTAAQDSGAEAASSRPAGSDPTP